MREGGTLSDEPLLFKAAENDTVGAFVKLMVIVLHGIEESPEVSDVVLVCEDTEHEVVNEGTGNETILGCGEVKEVEGFFRHFIEFLEDIDKGLLGGCGSEE